MCKSSSPSLVFQTSQNASSDKYMPLMKKEVSASGYKTGRWTAKEHEIFLEGLKELGKNWKEISAIMKTRSPVQVRTHAQKFFLKMAKAERALLGGDKEIEVEYTSLKKDTAVLSSCLEKIDAVPHKFDYEVKEVPSLQAKEEVGFLDKDDSSDLSDMAIDDSFFNSSFDDVVLSDSDTDFSSSENEPFYLDNMLLDEDKDELSFDDLDEFRIPNKKRKSEESYNFDFEYENFWKKYKPNFDENDFDDIVRRV